MYVFLTATVHHNKSGTDRSQLYSPVFKTTQGKLRKSRDKWSKHFRNLCGSNKFRGEGNYQTYADRDKARRRTRLIE